MVTVDAWGHGLSTVGGRQGEDRGTDGRETHEQERGSGMELRMATRSCCRWCSVAQATAVWAVCQEEAPLFPPLCLGEVWRRSLLAGALWLSLALCFLSLKALLHYRQQQEHFLESDVAVRERSAGLQACVGSERHMGGPVPVAHALMDSLLVCLLSEALENPSPPHIQALAHRLEMATEMLQRADILQGGPQSGGDLGARGDVEDPVLTDRLKGICDYLSQRLQSLHALLRAQGEYRDSVHAVLEGLQHRWAQLVVLHVRVTMEKGRVGEEDILTVLEEVKCLSMELGECRTRLQQCQALLNDSTHLLQELGCSQRGLGNCGGTRGETLWTERLLQSNTAQFEEVQHNLLSLENLTSCFQTHLEGLRMNEEMERTSQSHLDLSSSMCNSTPCVHPSDTPPLHSCPPPETQDQLPTAVSPTLCERSAQRLSSTLICLRSSLRRM
ncbi:uncharacterized protein si:ch211-151h10.2 isoform X2 [Megalops cyprinoides]|uniref:uncharacterized protein si:ch211-151h10.2 isoform X2 n=1 Tax=Megalops cyprinoides TaxID=118141 RepID=UPI0018649D54|nr:uncharacterized protein si:ch211-151h10.2 isoform X2 [Megalops cyprinoides]